MGKPFKMKYTNGKKADSSSFPFKGEVNTDSSPAKKWDWGKALKGGISGGLRGLASGNILGATAGLWGGAISGGMGKGKFLGGGAPEDPRENKE